MTHKEALQDLLEKIKAGTPTALDIATAFPKRGMETPYWFVRSICQNKDMNAARLLHEALRPEWRWSIHQPAPGVSRVSIAPWSILRPVPYTAEHQEPAVAWLIAIITGEIARCVND